MEQQLFYKALFIRKIEEIFLELFSLGKLNGTVHTCIGEEFSALAFAGQLEKKDTVFSNHRSHGHYIAFTEDYTGLLAELSGFKSGVCGGVGSSQHLYKKNFFSNGIQGGIVPNAAGIALANKLKQNNQIVVVYIGDGTLGEGIIYETMNIISKWNIPLLIVCENNMYAQSTPQAVNLAGNILNRAIAFDIATDKGSTEDPLELMEHGKKAINYVRDNQKPMFFEVNTYRLKAHSKGDDDRDNNEIESYRKRDPLSLFQLNNIDVFNTMNGDIENKIEEMLNSIPEEVLEIEEYADTPESYGENIWKELIFDNEKLFKRLNFFFKECLKDKQSIFIGEDVLSPYGGAFKIAKDLSSLYPDQVFSTPISEAAITGISNGLALSGYKPYLEIMFGDFITHSMDQIINHSSKYFHMYNKQITCPIVIRTPMGGRRGYGPTHSQSLDRFLLGIDNTKVVALNKLIDPVILYEKIHSEIHPVIVIENKSDYTRRIKAEDNKFFSYSVSDNNEYPIVKISPLKGTPNLTIVTYGGMIIFVEKILEKLFLEYEIIGEILVYSCIYPLNVSPILESVSLTHKLCTIEEGSGFSAWGSEVIANVAEHSFKEVKCHRISGMNIPIPSVKKLEKAVLPDEDSIIKEIKEKFYVRHS